MFGTAAAIIVVSRAMQQRLLDLGASPEKVHYNPYGVDCERFGGAKPACAGTTFVSVGRFTENNTPNLTLSAFAKDLKDCEDARLVMIGEGPLREACQQLADSLKISGAVSFLGAQSHSVAEVEMKQARCYVPHSVVAPSGDCEGKPVAILEAWAAGLPVVSTRHAGIPNVVVGQETGFVVDEGDICWHGRANDANCEESKVRGNDGTRRA